MFKPNANQVQELLTLAEFPDQAAAWRELAPVFGDFQPLPGRNWTSFPLRATIASVLVTAGYLQEGLSLAFRSVVAHGRDDLVMKVMDDGRRELFHSAMQALHHRRPDHARIYIDVARKIFANLLDLSPEASLIELMEFAAAAARPAAPSAAPQGRPSVISLCVWGDRFIRSAERTFLSCCLAPGNLPALREQGTVYLRISTQASDVEHLRSLPIVQEISRFAQIDFSVIPQTLLDGAHPYSRATWIRLVFGALTYADLMFARSIGGDIFLGGADVLLAESCFSSAKRLLQSGYEAVVVQPIRSVSSKILELLESYRDGPRFAVPSQKLYEAGYRTIHPFIRNSFMCEPPTHIPMDPIQFYVPTAAGFALHSFQLNVFGASTKRLPADLMFDFHTMDARFMSDITIGLDRSAACYLERQMPGDVYFVSLDEEGEVSSFGEFEVTPATAVKVISKWVVRHEDIDYFRWAVQQRFDYRRPDGAGFEPPANCLSEETAMADILRLLDNERGAIETALAAFA